MNSLTVIQNKIDICENRKKELQTPMGRKKADAEMLQILSALDTYGYPIPKDKDVKKMATAWRFALNDYIVLYGMNVIKQAVINYVKSDDSQYNRFPKVGEILAEIKKIGVNPYREKRLLELEEYEQKMEEEMDRRVEEWKKKNDNGNNG